jgi:polyphosphate kinase
MGSADWMPRNFMRRVECVFPIKNKTLRARIEKEILKVYREKLGDVKELNSEGQYLPCSPQGRSDTQVQATFLDLAKKHLADNVNAAKKTPSKSVRPRR